ncbi:MAG: AAA family ATPase [Ilumatobacteraceae bacterium]
MARSDHVKALLRSHRDGDEQHFRTTAEKIIEDARRRRHDLLADELEAILEEPIRTRRTTQLTTLRPLPKGRDETALVAVHHPQRTLHDLVLSSDVRDVLDGILEEQRTRASLHAHGVNPRASILFSGPSGTGKSATAEALAGELGWPLAHVQLATVVSSYLGETAKNLEQIFGFLSSGSCVLLFDEFDMLARDRSERGDHGELKRVVSALLQLIEETNTDSIVIATTNHASLLDSALWRRFDEIVAFGLPNSDQRTLLLEMKLNTVRCDVDFKMVAMSLDGCTHAEIESVALDAIRLMVTRLDRAINTIHIEYGVNRMEERRRIINTSQV